MKAIIMKALISIGGPNAGTVFGPAGAVNWANVKNSRYAMMVMIPDASVFSPQIKILTIIIANTRAKATIGATQTEW